MRWLLLTLHIVLFTSFAMAQALTPYSYDVGSPSVTDYYIDPSTGSDSNDGLSSSSAWRTVQHAWGQIPQSATLSNGFRFNLATGTYGTDELPNYWELREGTEAHPIILQPASDSSSVVFTRDINMANVSYFYLIGITIAPSPAGDAFHCERCDHLLIRGCTLDGGGASGGAHETLKVNQSQYVYLENNNIGGADDNAIDFVAVQYGHIIGNRVHDAADWCGYVKGGSAYLRIEGNAFYDCGTGGFTAGQGSGFQFMTSPWVHYEAYDIKFINNLIYRTEGAAFGVNGGYNVLMAHNTAYRVGSRSHLVEVVFGERTCDGKTNGAADADCSSHNAAGGWGPETVDTEPDPIGNKNISIVNNLIVNPSEVVAPQHFAVYGPRTPSAGTNIPSPQVTDTNLVIAGNVIQNGSGDTPLGVEDSEQGCQVGNPTCTAAQISSDNTINSLSLAFQDAALGDLRPTGETATLLQGITGAALTSFPGSDRPSTPSSPEGELSNAFTRDRSGAEVGGSRIAGAFGSSTSALTPPDIGGMETPEDPNGSAPEVSRIRVTQRRVARRAILKTSANVVSDSEVSHVTVAIVSRGRTLTSAALSLRSGVRYAGQARVRQPAGRRVSVVVRATGADGEGEARRTVRLQ